MIAVVCAARIVLHASVALLSTHALVETDLPYVVEGSALIVADASPHVKQLSLAMRMCQTGVYEPLQ